jgi:hypothetical protein
MPFICLSTFSTVKARRDDAARFAQAQSLRQLGELHREQFQARDVVLRLGLASHLVHLHHEVRQRALHALHLVDREVVMLNGSPSAWICR